MNKTWSRLARGLAWGLAALVIGGLVALVWPRKARREAALRPRKQVDGADERRSISHGENDAPESGATDPTPISLNRASLDALQHLPGIGPVLAERIVEARPFADVDDLQKVQGIGAATLERLAGLLEP